MKTYYEPIYKLWVSVFVEEDSDKARKKVERVLKDTLDLNWNVQAKTVEYVSEQGGQRIIVWLKRPDKSLLAHELIHVIEYCFERRGIPFNIESAEVIAYYMEHLFSYFENSLEKPRKSRRLK